MASVNPAGMSRLSATLCLLTWAVCAGISADQGAFQEWNRRLAAIETRMGRIEAADTAALQALASDLSQLRDEVKRWLETFPPARQDARPWLEDEPVVPAGLEDLAAGIGHLRSVLSRIDSAGRGSGGAGAFYLGRVDVAVTASTTASATTEMTPAGVTVVGEADLRANDRPTLSGALALAPGVTFTRVGSRNETAVYVRGYDMRQVPLFIDGVPIYTPYDGYVDLERFTTFDVSELRLSKGFTSVLYGPNALGGAINVVSRRPTGRIEGVAGASYGSGTSGTVYLNAGSRLNTWYLQGGGSYLDSNTFPLAGGFAAVKSQHGGDRLNAYKKDGKVNIKVGWTPNGTDEYAVSYVAQRGEKGNPPYAGTDPRARIRYWQWPYWDKDSVYFVSNTHVGSSTYLRARVFYDTYDNELHSFDDGTYTTQNRSSSFRSVHRDSTFGASAEWGTSIGRHTVRAAGHLKDDGHQDYDVGEPAKQVDGRVYSVGVEDSFALSSKLTIVGGVGFDRQTTSRALDYQDEVIDLLAECRAAGDKCGSTNGVNPQAGLFYSVPTGQVRLTVSRKTRMPSMKDRYSYRLGTAVPNPDLRSEHNLTFEGGYQGTLGQKTSFHATVFYSRIRDLMQDFYLEPDLSQLQNIGRASSSGLELDWRTRLIRFVDLGANYTFIDRDNLSDPATPLFDTPRHKARLSVVGTLAPFLQLVGGVDFEAGRRTQTNAGTEVDVASFAVVNLKSVWTIRRRVDAEIGVLNAFDTFYWVAEGFPEAGRTLLGTIRWRF